jgi:hypothetical protein
MAKNYFSNLKNLVNDYRSGSFDGFSIDLEDDRDFNEFLEYERINGIDLYSGVSDSVKDKAGGLDNWLTGRELKVSVNGTKLFNTSVKKADLRFGGSSEKLKFDLPSIFQGYTAESNIGRNIDALPDDIDNYRDLARGLGVTDGGGTISFKPVNNDPVSNQSENVKDKVKEKVKSSNKSLGLILPVILGLTAFYYVVFK